MTPEMWAAQGTWAGVIVTALTIPFSIGALILAILSLREAQRTRMDAIAPFVVPGPFKTEETVKDGQQEIVANLSVKNIGEGAAVSITLNADLRYNQFYRFIGYLAPGQEFKFTTKPYANQIQDKEGPSIRLETVYEDVFGCTFCSDSVVQEDKRAGGYVMKMISPARREMKKKKGPQASQSEIPERESSEA